LPLAKIEQKFYNESELLLRLTVRKELSMHTNWSKINVMDLLKSITTKRGVLFGFILFGALIAFEIFNFSTTEFALQDILGSELNFMGIGWAVVLAVAFCGIDFAGIARLFTPEQGRNEPVEVWYLFGAWLLAAMMNATLTWWGVSVAIRNHQTLGAAVVGQDALLKIVPIFVAVMVWVIRVLIIGTFSIAGERVFSMADDRPAFGGFRAKPRPASVEYPRPSPSTPTPRPVPALASARSLMQSGHSAPKPDATHRPGPAPRSEPTYHPIGMAASPKDDVMSVRR
jgi:hypothetical protein